MIALVAILGAFLRRAYGGGLGIRKTWFLVPMAALAGYLAHLAGGPWLGLTVAAATAVYWSMGHGSYMDMGTQPEPDNERFKYVLIYLFGEETKPSTLRDFVGMTLRYGAPSLLIAALYAFWGIYGGLWLPAAAIATAVGYWAAMRLRAYLPSRGRFLDGFSAYGELIAGAAFYGALAALA